MKAITIDEILTATGGLLVQGNREDKVSDISTDSRKIKDKALFVPLKGENFDGHDYIESAIDNGASTVISHLRMETSRENVNFILVDDTLKALQSLAAYYRKTFNIPIIAITGSTGKTTTKDMIYQVLSTRYSVLKTKGNYNNHIGLPLTIFELGDNHDVAVVEMGMSGLGEIHDLVNIALPTMAIITNIGTAHIEKLGSRENILKAKMEIFDNFMPGSTGLLNGDDDMLNSVSDSLPFKVVYFGFEKKCDYRAQDVTTKGEEGIEYKIYMEDAVYEIALKIPGRHNVYNSLAAIAVGRLFNIDMELIKDALNNFRTGDMRLNIIRIDNNIKIIDDVYNASTDSMKAALTILKDFSGKRKIAILGDMLEMGEESEKEHREVGKSAFENGIDIIITKGENSEMIGIQAIDMGMPSKNVFHFKCNKDVIDFLSTFVQRDDTILVKGSRGMKMEKIVESIRERGADF